MHVRWKRTADTANVVFHVRLLGGMGWENVGHHTKRLLVFVHGDDCVILSNASGQVNAEKNR